MKIEFKLSPVYPISFVILFILKITKVINWSWWIITFPLWFPCIVFLIMLIMIMIIYKKQIKEINFEKENDND